MPVERLLSELLHREPATDSDHRPETAVLHECRHCGSKFDDPITECPVCGAAEIATYEFPSGDPDADDADGAADVDADADAGDGSTTDRSH
ncbi:hypothetical protein [Natrarchaeobaculum aegyptiacum]|uniref:Uncharacterized protein n=1 Tax=Natrarchaeobaculum aegyptiacum TaxID=745377 RepID=A0A2Z2HQG0_9EURY|nr:hypothetical protein [Natrarchaeobaculum aegyptiacum]ARS89386.1 hypothetical protein B1756_06235 [Natrarchaeobaculum aegyptiacum]